MFGVNRYIGYFLHPLTKRRSALKLTFWQKRRRNSNVFLFFSLYSDQEYSILKEKRKKTSGNIWKICLKASYLCTRFPRRGWRWVGFLDRGGAKNFFFFYLPFAKRDDEKKKKNFRNYLEDILKSSYLCIRFLKRKAVLKRSDLWRIYINNTSSTRAGASQINN